MNTCIRRVLAVAVVVVLSAGDVACNAPVAEPVRLTTDRLGNVFAPDEPIRLTAAGPSGPRMWLLRDWQGTRRAGGTGT